MFCPNCKCEYIRGVRECADCGVSLVDKLEPQETTSSLNDVRIVPVWRGKDSSEFERVRDELADAGILFTAPDATKTIFLPSEPLLEIWVAEADRQAAEKVISDFEDSMSPDELASDQHEPLDLPESDEMDESDEPEEDDDAGATSDLELEWHEDDPVSEVWNGETEAFAENLVMCLREIGIASRKLQEGARWSVVVRPEQLKRAKEIVREVLEASPPD